MELDRAKGTREIDPKDKLVMNNILSVITKNFELYGFMPLETPTLQRFDVLSSKYAGGAEILKETFKLKDQGKRQLALRYDLTVPLCLYVGLNPNIKLPFKRYEIGKVFRDGPVSSERFREFWQCDVDTVGSYSMMADAEFVNIVFKIFNELNMNAVVKINNRKILDVIMQYAGVKDSSSAILSIDKLDKIGIEGVKKELREKKLTKSQIDKVIGIISINGNNKIKLMRLKSILGENDGVKEIEELLVYCNGKVEFDISLARGLAYYTGTIFECFLVNDNVKTAVASGGRYDKIIGSFLNNKQEYPAVGISFGLDRIAVALKSGGIIPVKCFIISIGNTKLESQKLAEELRSNNISVCLDIIGRGISKNLDYANSLNIPYVIFIGEDELKKGKYKLKNMKTGKEDMMILNEILNVLK